jgi:hypothetical protein
MRAFVVAAVALAMHVDRKLLDNVLSRHAVRGTAKGRQGRSRRITPETVLTLAITLDLMHALSLTAAAAIALAERVIDAPQGELQLMDGMTLRVNVERTTREVAERLRDVGESVVPRRRGRPRATRGTAARSESGWARASQGGPTRER